MVHKGAEELRHLAQYDVVDLDVGVARRPLVTGLAGDGACLAADAAVEIDQKRIEGHSIMPP
jgi:hypothetical protein